MISRKGLLYIFLIFFLILMPSVTADGVFFRPNVYYNEDLFEPTQKAIILHDGVKEKMLLEVSYKGSMSDFAWIIPVPSYPDINKTSAYIFEELHYLTAPEYRSAPRLYAFGNLAPSKMLEQGVNILEQKQVGVYETTILTSDDPEALINWLNNNDYYVSQDAESMLDYYIAKRWYFIAARINLKPYDARLLASLRNINSSIKSIEDARTVLTEQLVGHVLSKRQYYELYSIQSTLLDYDNDTDEIFYGKNANSPDSKPSRLIIDSEYTAAYERYNGYLNDHIRSEIDTAIREKFIADTSYPDYYSCQYPGNNPKIDNEKCSIWKYLKTDPQYRILEGVDCGSYCGLLSASKTDFTISDIAQVAAYAIVNGDDSVKAYFSVGTDTRNWYDTAEDKQMNIYNSISGKLQDEKSVLKSAAESRARSEWLQKYSQMIGAPEYLDGFMAYIVVETLKDFASGHDYLESAVFKPSLISQDKYLELKNKYSGDKDIYALRQAMQASVDKVVNWKKQAVSSSLGQGNLQPLLIEFASDKIIYPLKVSSINKGVSEVLLYVFAKHKTMIDNVEGFNVEYAKWIETEDIKNSNYDSYRQRMLVSKEMMPMYYRPNTYYYTNELLDDKYFLTKFRAQLWPKDMKEDLIIEKALNNKSYRLVTYESGYWISLLFSLIFILIYLGFLFGIVMLCSLLNNRFVRSEDSLLYVNVKRAAAYASVIPILLVLMMIFRPFADIMSHLLENYFSIFEFFYNLFHYLHVPAVLSGFLILIIGILLTFYIVHLTISCLLLLWRNINNRGLSGIIDWRIVIMLALFCIVSVAIFLTVLFAASNALNLSNLITMAYISLFSMLIIVVPYVLWAFLFGVRRR